MLGKAGAASKTFTAPSAEQPEPRRRGGRGAGGGRSWSASPIPSDGGDANS